MAASMATKNPMSSEPALQGPPQETSFTSVFHDDAIVVFADGETKSSVISTLVQRLVVTGRLNPKCADEVTRQIQQRESLASNAIGRGFAFPHLRSHCVQEFVGAIGILPAGIPFDSMDGSPTKIVFLTLSPHACRRQHTELLSRLVSLLSNRATTVRMVEDHNAIRLHRNLCWLDGQT